MSKIETQKSSDLPKSPCWQVANPSLLFTSPDPNWHLVANILDFFLQWIPEKKDSPKKGSWKGIQALEQSEEKEVGQRSVAEKKVYVWSKEEGNDFS